MSDYLRGPWQAVISLKGDILPDIDALHGEDGADICIVRGSAIPIPLGDGCYDWPSGMSGDDVIELWDDLEFDEAEIRWVQVQAMTAGLNAASEAATR